MSQPIEFEQGSDTWKKLRKRAQTDLYWLNAKVRQLENVVPMRPQVHLGMCKFAERRTGIPEIDVARIQLIQAARGTGKSSMITAGRTIQRILQDRNWSAGIANESADKAKKFLGWIKAEFESNDFLRFLFPELIPDFRKTIWAADQIVVNRTRNDAVNPSVVALGVGSQTAGFHFNEIIVDDIISDDAAENARKGLFTEMEAANLWVTRIPPLLKMPQRDSITFIGTPWYLDDTYSFIVNTFGHNEEPQRFAWFIELPDGTTQQIDLEKRGDVAIFKLPIVDAAGKSIFPELITSEEYQNRYIENPLFALSQYRLIPTGGLAASFKREWLNEYQWEGNKQIFYQQDGRVHYVRVSDLVTTISVDPAISKKDTAARSAICVTGTDGEKIFLLEAWCGRVGATELAQRVIEFTKQYSPHRIVVETVAYQAALKEVLDLLIGQQKLPKAMFPIADFHPGPQGKKDVRIYGLEPWFRKGLVYFDPKSQAEFEGEYVNFPNQKLRDIIDALSMQKDQWEKLNNTGKGIGTRLSNMRDAEKAKIARIKEVMSGRHRQH